MRKLVLGTLFGFLVAATAALALDVSFPTRSKAQARVIVDELGNVLFGAMPAKVEVTNLPPSSGGYEPWSVTVPTGYVQSPVQLFSVPADKRLVITDIDGRYTCYVNGNGSVPCTLSDSSGVRLTWTYDSSRVRSYVTGLSFGPNETVMWGVDPLGVPPPNMQVTGPITFMGRLEPAS